MQGEKKFMQGEKKFMQGKIKLSYMQCDDGYVPRTSWRGLEF
jgi:hypothetical protein